MSEPSLSPFKKAQNPFVRYFVLFLKIILFPILFMANPKLYTKDTAMTDGYEDPEISPKPLDSGKGKENSAD